MLKTNFIRALIILTGCALLSFAAFFTHANDTKKISVVGQGEVLSKPDHMHFAIFLEEKGETATKLSEKLQQKVTLIVNMLKRKGVETPRIRMLPVQLQPWLERRNNEPKQKGFVLSQQLQIKLVNFEIYADVLDNVLRIGAARIGGSHYGIENSDVLYQQALDIALQNANIQAKFIAEKMQVELGNILDIEVHAGFSPGHRNLENTRLAVVNQALLPGQIETQAQVSVTYAIK